jgi:hypothetical protein
VRKDGVDLPQHASPQARRPSGHIVGSPAEQVTLQLPTLVHVTEHVPVQVTLHVPTLVQTALPPSSRVGAQVLALSQVYTQPAPQRASQLLTLKQLALQSSPHSTEQLVPFWQSKSQSPAHTARQSSAPSHVGAHSRWTPQSRSHRSSCPQVQGASTQGIGGPQEAKESVPMETARPASQCFTMRRILSQLSPRRPSARRRRPVTRRSSVRSHPEAGRDPIRRGQRAPLHAKMLRST